MNAEHEDEWKSEVRYVLSAIDPDGGNQFQRQRAALAAEEFVGGRVR